jgi:hypothetical protein
MLVEDNRLYLACQILYILTSKGPKTAFSKGFLKNALSTTAVNHNKQAYHHQFSY